MFAEKKVKDKWEKIGPVFGSTYSSDKGKLVDEPYTGRNYELFAFLANVRNRFDIVPLSEPRGWPKDLSEALEKELKEYWDSDGHSASWFTLRELLEADWDRKIRVGGVVPADVYEYLTQLKEVPKIYSQGISGPNILTVSEEEWEKLQWSEKINGTRWHIYMYWEVSLKEQCDLFVTNTIPALQKQGNPDEIRIVFNFDN